MLKIDRLLIDFFSEKGFYIQSGLVHLSIRLFDRHDRSVVIIFSSKEVFPYKNLYENSENENEDVLKVCYNSVAWGRRHEEYFDLREPDSLDRLESRVLGYLDSGVIKFSKEE